MTICMYEETNPWNITLPFKEYIVAIFNATILDIKILFYSLIDSYNHLWNISQL
jgi:hypothetical protein